MRHRDSAPAGGLTSPCQPLGEISMMFVNRRLRFHFVNSKKICLLLPEAHDRFSTTDDNFGMGLKSYPHYHHFCG